MSIWIIHRRTRRRKADGLHGCDGVDLFRRVIRSDSGCVDRNVDVGLVEEEKKKIIVNKRDLILNM